jgi:serpin B
LRGAGPLRPGKHGRPDRPAIPISDDVVRHNAFAIDYFRQVAGTTNGNVVISPFGLYLVLAILRDGAAGQGEEELARVMHQPSLDALRRAYPVWSKRLGRLARHKGYELRLSSRIWFEEGEPLRAAFLGAARQDFQVAAFPLPFERDPETAAKTINDWTASATKNRIRSLITPDEISADRDQPFRVAVTNVIHLEAAWRRPFDPSNTRKETFHTPAGPRDVMLMKGDAKDVCGYAALDNLEILDKPYKEGSDLGLLLLLPADQPHALENLEKSLSPANLEGWCAKLAREPVMVELPRFELRSVSELAPILKAMGLSRPFRSNSDFQEIAEGEFVLRLFRQACRLTVDEKGTVATAATIGGFGGGMHTFRADHPFLFLIRDHATGLILFMGRVAEPVEPQAGDR